MEREEGRIDGKGKKTEVGYEVDGVGIDIKGVCWNM